MKKNINKNIVALDLGTTKFCMGTFFASKGSQQTKILTEEVPALGMKKGMLSDLKKATDSIKKLVESSEETFDRDIRKAVVGVAGSHLKSYRSIKTFSAPRTEVTPELLDRIESDISSSPRSERENLHTIPIAYKIDNRSWIENPLDMTANHIACKYLVIDADRNYLKDLIHVCNQAGIEVKHLYAEPFASSSVTVTKEQKEFGIAIADIGGGTTDGIVFQNGKPDALFTLNVGGLLMTRDLAIGLNLINSEAEKVKKFFGIAESPLPSIECVDINGKLREIHQKDVQKIIRPRFNELCYLLAQELKPYAGNLGGGIAFTGGGASIKDIEQFASTFFEVNVSTIQPSLGQLPNSEIFANRYATLLGLLNLELGQKLGRDISQLTWKDRYMNYFVNWIKDLS